MPFSLSPPVLSISLSHTHTPTSAVGISPEELWHGSRKCQSASFSSALWMCQKMPSPTPQHLTNRSAEKRTSKTKGKKRKKESEAKEGGWAWQKNQKRTFYGVAILVKGLFFSETLSKIDLIWSELCSGKQKKKAIALINIRKRTESQTLFLGVCTITLQM